MDNRTKHSAGYVFIVLAICFAILLASFDIWNRFTQSLLDAKSNEITVKNDTIAKYETEISELQNKYDKSESTVKKQKEKISELRDIAEQAKSQKVATSCTVSPTSSSAVVTNDSSYIGEFTITYYCGENYPHICGTGNGVTASGVIATAGVTIAADPNVLPIGTHVYIDGIGERVVQDTGGVIIGNKIDIFVETHNEAISNGMHTASVYRV